MWLLKGFLCQWRMFAMLPIDVDLKTHLLQAERRE